MLFFNRFVNIRLNRLRLIQKFVYRDITSCIKNRNVYETHRYQALCINRFKIVHKEDSILHNLAFKCERKYCIKNIVDNVIKDKENEYDSIKSLFPQPRVTLNEFAAKRPEKTFDIIYKPKQPIISPKGTKKKSKIVQKNDWTCIYSFSWPQKEKFECTALTKKQAAEKSATQALFWLYQHKHIDNKGRPVYSQEVVSHVKGEICKPLRIEVGDNSVERIQRIWADYEKDIKDVYSRSHHRALERDKLINAEAILDSMDNEDGLPENETELDNINEVTETSSFVHPVFGRYIKKPSTASLIRRRINLEEAFRESSGSLTPLPIDNYTSKICAALKESRVVIIVGSAGCGKSTRAPRAILRENGVDTNIVVTEPRRVAALGLAERVADELMEEIGQTVGYQVRLSSKLPSPPSGAILYATSGVLLRRLLNNPGLFGCTHIIIDEAHERDINTDVILLLLKRSLTLNENLKVIIMSATLNTDVFTRYFDNCPVIEVPGRTFPVKETYLEDIATRYPGISLRNTMNRCAKDGEKPYIYCDEIANLIKAIDSKEPEGAILFFLPGWAEIKTVKNLLANRFPNSSRHLILPVHSKLATTEQTKIFCKPPPGVRKIVLATNIAETSITVPDVVYVGDSGTYKEASTRLSGASSMECVWISKAAAKQRAGRAGRVQPGHCFKLYTREKENEFVAHNTPEILRVPLDQTVLQCKTYAPKESIQDFLSQLPEPPDNRAIQCAINDLVDLGALTLPNLKLSSLGTVLSCMTAPPRISAMLVYGAIAGNIVGASDVVTQLADNVKVFKDLTGERTEEIRNIKSTFSSNSDHVAMHRIQNEYEDILINQGRGRAEEFCDKYGLRQDRLQFSKAISNIYMGQLLKTNIFDLDTNIEEYNRFSSVNELLKAVVLCGSNKLILAKKVLKSRGKLGITRGIFATSGEKAHIGTDSVNYTLNKHNPSLDSSNVLTYYGGFHSVERRALILHNTSLISPETVLLFSQGEIQKMSSDDNSDDAILHLPRHKLDIHCSSRDADAIIKVRTMIWETFQYYIERDKAQDLDQSETIFRFKQRLFKSIVKLLTEAENNLLRNVRNKVQNDYCDVE